LSNNIDVNKIRESTASNDRDPFRLPWTDDTESIYATALGRGVAPGQRPVEPAAKRFEDPANPWLASG
jgi:hypothetical protein